MEDELNVPIALRRTPRHSKEHSHTSRQDPDGSTTAKCAKTPSRRSGKKRVRFSDPGPEISHAATSSTGLTPMIRRSSLRASPSSKRRRHSSPIRHRADDEEDELSGGAYPAAAKEIRIFPLRQILDERVKRRIRRNGLSEEMNTIHDEKKRKAQKANEELERLREELAEKDEEIERLMDTTVIQDGDRIQELEQHIEELRDELGHRSESSKTHEWTLAARDPFSDTYMDDDHFGDTTMADFVCSTPSRAMGSGSFLTPPRTSPTLPETPVSHHRKPPVTPTAQAGVQVQLEDPEKSALEDELSSLRLELTKLTETIDAHEALKTRITEKLSAAKAPDPEGSPDLEAHLDTVLQSLSDKTMALVELNSSLSSLGFRGDDASEIVASLAGAFRAARLELEYLTPGEITLPLTSHGAEVLDLVLSRLRDLARKVQDNEDSIDEYHALELSLRQQLGTRVDAMDSMRRDLNRNTTRLKEKNDRIAELEIGTDRLKGAIEGYRRDISELETLVQRLEDQSRETESSLQAEIEAGKQEVQLKEDAIAELEAKLKTVLSQTAGLRIQLADVQAKKVLEITVLNKSHGNALAFRDARVMELRNKMDDITNALHNAQQKIHQLRVDNEGLKGTVDAEKKKAKDAIDAMKAELERVLAMSEGILATPKAEKGESSSSRKRRKSSSAEPAVHGGRVTRSAKGKRRRRYDSGLGFLDEEQDEIQI